MNIACFPAEIVMRALTVSALIGADHTLTAQVPADIPPGTHQVVVVLATAPSGNPPQPLFFNSPPHDVGPADPACTYRREDL